MTSRQTHSSRPSEATSPAPKPPTKIHSTAVIADKAQLSGTHPIEIGENTIIHGYAKIRSDGGKVTIGNNCSISEKTELKSSTKDGKDYELVIGDAVNIETSAIVGGCTIGDGTVVEVGAKIGYGVKIGRHCKICPLESVPTGSVVEDFTVVYGDGKRRVDESLRDSKEVMEAKERGQGMMLELLRRLIPDAGARWRDG